MYSISDVYISERFLHDRVASIRNIIEKCNYNCSHVLQPDEFLVLDETLYGNGIEVSFKQYNKSKPAKYGLLFESVNAAKYLFTLRAARSLCRETSRRTRSMLHPRNNTTTTGPPPPSPPPPVHHHHHHHHYHHHHQSGCFVSSCRTCVAMVHEFTNYLLYNVITLYSVCNCVLNCIHMYSKHCCYHECSDISPNTFKEIHYINKLKVSCENSLCRFLRTQPLS